MKINVDSIGKEFKKVAVLNKVNMQFESGKIYGLIGRNGTGKTVLLKMLCGFYIPTNGTITFDGINYIKNGEFPKNMGALIENPSFLPDLTGFENLKLLSMIQKKIDDNQIMNTLKLVNLYEEKDKKYSKYSLGMKQKLGIAQAIMENPEIIILDEPFSGIEKETVEKLKQVFLNLKKENKIIILSSHINQDIEDLADVIYEFDGGTVSKI